jgi:pimeloyl-ACP methyl ester carboxylesterase
VGTPARVFFIEQMSAPSNSPRAWLRIIVRSFAVLVVFLATLGYIYENISEARDRRFNPMPGQLIDVGGYKMHIYCTGHGAPTVILDSGLGDSYISWTKVQPQISEFSRVCSYDRAGLGYSDSSPRPRTSKVFAEELHTLLHNAGVPPPYIFVGHSMGGFDVRLYASFYRSEVAGMVLVDSSHPEQKKRLPPELNDLDKTWLREQEFMEFTTPFGIPRLIGFCGPDAEVRAADCNFHSLREGVAELSAVAESAAETAATRPLGDMPLVVLTRDPAQPEADLPEDLVKPTAQVWQQMQDELAQLSTKNTHVIAKHSGHYIQLDRPDLVVEAVRKIADETRQIQSQPEPKP